MEQHLEVTTYHPNKHAFELIEIVTLGKNATGFVYLITSNHPYVLQQTKTAQVTVPLVALEYLW